MEKENKFKNFLKKASDLLAPEPTETVKPEDFTNIIIRYIKRVIEEFKMAGKHAIEDTVTSTLHLALYHTDDIPKDRKKIGNYTNYTSYSYNGGRPSSDRDSGPLRPVQVFDEIQFASRKAAEDALEDLKEITYKYGSASIGDFYDVLSEGYGFKVMTVPGDFKRGWTDLSGSSVKMYQGAYVLKLPDPKPFD